MLPDDSMLSTSRRDAKQSKVYRAEFPIRKMPQVRNYSTREDVVAFVNKVVGSAFYRRTWPQASRTRTVVFGRCVHSAWGNRWEIELPSRPDWAWNQVVILHEIAHGVVAAQKDSKFSPGHGRDFRTVLLKLLRRFIGVEVNRAMRRSFVKNGIKWRGTDKEVAQRRWKRNVPAEPCEKDECRRAHCRDCRRHVFPGKPCKRCA